MVQFKCIFFVNKKQHTNFVVWFSCCRYLINHLLILKCRSFSDGMVCLDLYVLLAIRFIKIQKFLSSSSSIIYWYNRHSQGDNYFTSASSKDVLLKTFSFLGRQIFSQISLTIFRTFRISFASVKADLANIAYGMILIKFVPLSFVTYFINW